MSVLKEKKNKQTSYCVIRSRDVDDFNEVLIYSFMNSTHWILLAPCIINSLPQTCDVMYFQSPITEID